MKLDGTRPVYGDTITGWYLVALGQYMLVLLAIRWYRVSIGRLCLSILKSRDLGGCYRCLTDRQSKEYFVC